MKTKMEMRSLFYINIALMLFSWFIVLVAFMEGK